MTKSRIFFFSIIAIAIFASGFRCGKGKDQPPAVGKVISHSDTVTKWIAIHDTITKFTAIKTEANPNSSNSSYSNICDDSMRTYINYPLDTLSGDTVAKITTKVTGNLTGLIFDGRQKIITIHRSDSIFVAIPCDIRSWNLFTGGFISKDLNISGGASLSLRVKDIIAGISVDPFQNRSMINLQIRIK